MAAGPETAASRHEPDLASVEDAQLIKSTGIVEESAADATTPDASSSGQFEIKSPEVNECRPRPVQRLLFDDQTAAKVPGEDQFVQPWNQEREAQLAQAAEDLELKRTGIARAADAPQTEAAPAVSFMEPRTLDDLPAELKPYFRRIERYSSLASGITPSYAAPPSARNQSCSVYSFLGSYGDFSGEYVLIRVRE